MEALSGNERAAFDLNRHIAASDLINKRIDRGMFGTKHAVFEADSRGGL
jgi:hypothetical protein